MMPKTGNRKKLLIAALVVLISVWHYATNVHHSVLHILHRELYLLPIVLAAYWFGKKGGLTASITSSLLFIPWIFMNHHVGITNQLNNVLELLTFNGVAYFLGSYRDARRTRYTKLWRPGAEKPVSSRNGILLAIDNSANAMKTSKYVADHFAMDPGTKVTIMGFIREPSEDLFGEPDEYRKAKLDNEGNIAALLDDAHKTLLSRGFLPESINVKTIRIRKETVAARLLEEQKRNPCDTIVVGGVKLSKPEEFMFGNLAVKLVRESDCPVVTVY